MGEIATWSAVKTKVGLGKDSNECPTKAELLALSPTGTGENYVGLEISNASSYGNNETVQLSDIHKVTYKYTFTVDRTTLSFPASGGAPSPNLWFGLVSRKQKYVDGVISGSYTEVSYTQTAYPDWVSYNQTVPQYEAKENTGLVERSANRTHTQNESGKQITVQFTQAAATSTWAYTFTLTKASSNSIGALGGKVTFEIDSYKQEIRNGHNYGSQIPVSYKRTDDPDSSEILEMTIPENKTESSRGFNYIWTQDESNKKQNYTVTQAAGVKTYGNITITPTGDVPDIPASGGASYTFPYTWTQPWGWNGKTNDGGTLTTGGTETWNASVSGFNLGTTAKARTKLGVRTVTVTCNGKSGTATKDVYQAENKITNVTQGAWVVSISANPSTLTEIGGTSQIFASARASRTNHWSSGATNAASDATGTPTLSIPTAVTGFSLSGTTLTVAENKTANQRSVVVRATMDTVHKEVTVTQSAYLVEWRYTLTTSTPTLNFDALGTTKSGTISSYREKYINGSLVEGSHEGVNIQVKSTSAEIQSATAAVAITLKENTTTQARTGTVVYEQVGSGKTVTITCNQAAGTVTIKQEFHAELGNYYFYGDSSQIPLIYQWYSPDSSDITNIGDMIPGGYTGVWCNLPATGVINCMITGKPQTGKHIKARLSNLQARTIEDFDSSSPTEINKGLSVGYSQQDYQMGIEYSPGMNNYFLITPSILSEAGSYGGGIRLEVSLRSSYSGNGTTIATVTLTPKNSDHPTIYFEVIYG